MNLTTTYLVTANVVTTDERTGASRSTQVPAFHVTAVSDANAEAIAADIINPARIKMSIHMVTACMADITFATL